VSLSLSERIELAHFAVRHTPPVKQVIVSLAAPNLADMITFSKVLSDLGVAGALALAPYTSPPLFQIVLEFFRRLDLSYALPLIFYDNRVFTKDLASRRRTDHSVRASPQS
jgi:dihydrodipicolinate synthase/N-acetylneuraminate lyase